MVDIQPAAAEIRRGKKKEEEIKKNKERGRRKKPQDENIMAFVLKNIRPLTCYNLDMHDPITTIFDKSVTDKVRFPTSHI